MEVLLVIQLILTLQVTWYMLFDLNNFRKILHQNSMSTSQQGWDLHIYFQSSANIFLKKTTTYILICCFYF